MSRTAQMPGPVDPIKSQAPVEDGFFDLLVETLRYMERPALGQFLQCFFRSVAQLDLTEDHSLEYWDKILSRRRELSESLGQPISLPTAMVDVLSSSNCLRVPILVEYEDLKKLQINAATDPLTGLHNRRLFEEYFEKELNGARRHNYNLALMVMDLSGFKEVNDRHGHPQGDLVLQVAASTLRKSLRTSDFAFRIGGDEFALLLPQAELEHATALGRRLALNFESAMQPMHLDVSVGLDYGVSIFPQDGDQKDVLIRLADERLYQLKHNHRSSLRVFPQKRPVPSEVPSPPPSVAVAREAVLPPEPLLEPDAHGERQAIPERRKWERVSLAGTRAYALMGEKQEISARILDLSYGGVALQLDSPDGLPVTFSAVLHVPILPPVRVSLRRIYLLPTEGPAVRIGCSFVS